MSFPAHVLRFAEELRAEGVAIGTSELNDAFAALGEVRWTAAMPFREALAATLAKSPDDRRVFALVFERFFFRAAEAAAVREGIREGDGDGDALARDRGVSESGGAEPPYKLDELRQRIAAALRDGSEAALRDLARLALAAFGRRGEGSGVIGVDVQPPPASATPGRPAAGRSSRRSRGAPLRRSR